MNEIFVSWAMVVGIGFAALVLAYFIPFTQGLAILAFQGIFFVVKELLHHKWLFLIWFFKTIGSDHARVFQHATQTEEELDPTQRIRRQAKGYLD